MLEDRIKVLKTLNDNFNISQRALSKKTNISLGKINSILKEFTENGIIDRIMNNKGALYKVTEIGMELLENRVKSAKDERINIHEEEKKILKNAVILAAGKKEAFDTQIGMLEVEDFKLIDRTIDILKENGINKIIIVTGYKSEHFEKYFKDSKNVTLIKSDKYKWTGSMYSLSLIKGYIQDDFLLIDNDIIFESRAIKEICQSSARDCVMITNESGSGNEAFVEIRNNHLYKMSKDIHQFNKIDGEMIGLTKLSYKLYGMMLKEFENNINPYLNYEYVLLDVARNYKISYVKIDDLVWADIDNIKQYEAVKNTIYQTIHRREVSYEMDIIRKAICHIFKVDMKDISEVVRVGGLTNKNYKICVKGNKYIFRIAGVGTDSMIDRNTEMINSAIASERGYNVEVPYFNVDNGIKVSKFIEDAETLTARSIKKEENLKKATDILRKLHNDSMFKMHGEFNPFKELRKYEEILKKDNGYFYDGYEEVREKFMTFEEELKRCKAVKGPSHGDVIYANLVKDTQGSMYLIDWEYSGLNDNMWDLASMALEAEFNEDDVELMFRLYFEGKEADANSRRRFLIHEVCQDILWAVWTLIKEVEGEDFGTYGIDRYNRAKENLKKL